MKYYNIQVKLQKKSTGLLEVEKDVLMLKWNVLVLKLDLGDCSHPMLKFKMSFVPTALHLGEQSERACFKRFADEK